MDVLNTVVNAAVIVAVGILLGRYLKGKFDDVERRFDENDRRWEANDRRWEANDRRLAAIEARLDAHAARFDAIEARMASFERALDGMRSDLTRVALAVGTGPAAGTGGAP